MANDNKNRHLLGSAV